MTLKTVVITWMDGPVATYENVTASVLNGEVHIQQYTPGGVLLPGKDWHFPIANIRARGAVPWEEDQ